MGKKRKVYKPATVELELDGETRYFKITIDGSVYYLEKREARPKNVEDVMMAAKQGKQTVTRSTWHTVKNTAVQRMVFAKYMEQLAEKEPPAEEES
jgi:hypothetical protein